MSEPSATSPTTVGASLDRPAGSRPGRPRNRLVAAGVATLICLLASCGGDDVDGRIEAALDDGDTASPLNALLGIESPNSDTLDAERRAQESLVQCMAAAGFRYVPVYVSDDGAIVAEPVEGVDDHSIEFVEEHGYGITDRLQAELLSEVTDEDPNETIRAALSPAEMAAYDTAMSGISDDELTWDPEREMPVDPVTGSSIDQATFAAASADGCLSQAYQDPGAASDAAFELLTSQSYADLQDQISADPEMLTLQGGWRTCMSERGLRYQLSQQLIDMIDTRAQEIAHEAGSDHHDVSDDEAADMIAALRVDEIELAVADWTCSQELAARAPAIIRRHEAEFVREHEDLIVQILDEQREP